MSTHRNRTEFGTAMWRAENKMDAVRAPDMRSKRLWKVASQALFLLFERPLCDGAKTLSNTVAPVQDQKKRIFFQYYVSVTNE